MRRSRRSSPLAAGLARCAILGGALFVPIPLLADGTYVKEGGGTVTPMANTEVQLVREEIDIAVDRPHLLAPDSTLAVTVTYRFRNHTDRALRVAMGFPLRYDRSLQYIQGANYFHYCVRNPISAFRAAVDGRGVPVRPRRAKGVAPENLGCRRVSDERGYALQENDRGGLKKQPFAVYQVWTVAFAPRQERTVTNRFRYSAREGIYELANSFVYVLRTGASWKDVIERAVIRLRLNDKGCLIAGAGRGERCGYRGEDLDVAPSLREDRYTFPTALPESITPPGARIRTTASGAVEVVWDLKRFEPTQDVRFSYETALAARQELRKMIEKLARGKADRPQLARARELLRALYGVRFADPAAQRRVAARSWYVVDPRMTRARARALDALLRRLDARLR